MIPDEHAPRHRVVVIGAGFGGLGAAKALAGLAVDVIVIDRNNHHLFQPLLYQVATAALSPADIASPIRSILSRHPNVEVIIGEVVSIDADARRVAVQDVGEVGYDHLVIASGAVSSWFGHSDWAEHATGLKSLQDAETLRERLLVAFELAENSTDPNEVERLLTFVIVGGGPSGVELAAALRDLAQYSLARDFRRITPGHARIVLFEAGDDVLAGFPSALVRYARQRLERLGVDVRTGVEVEQIDDEGVVAAGERIPAANVFWCAGVAATKAAQWLGGTSHTLATGKHGTVAVDAECSVPGHPEIFAIGDVASCKGEDGPLPGVAPVAKQQGHYVAKVIAARLNGGPAPGPFRYHDQGSLAVVGRSAAVASLPKMTLVGIPAFLLWGCVHLFLLVGLRNRILVYVQWVSAWLFNARTARLIRSGAAGFPERNGRSDKHG